MKIETPAGYSPLPPSQEGRRGLPTTSNSGSTPSGEQVSLSEAARQISQNGSPSSINAPIDASRIAEIQAAIRDGSYRINPGKIADSLLSSVRDLLFREPAPRPD